MSGTRIGVMTAGCLPTAETNCKSCVRRVPLGEICKILKEFGFSGSVEKLARWLEKEGVRPRERRPRKPKGTTE